MSGDNVIQGTVKVGAFKRKAIAVDRITGHTDYYMLVASSQLMGDAYAALVDDDVIATFSPNKEC